MMANISFQNIQYKGLKALILQIRPIKTFEENTVMKPKHCSTKKVQNINMEKVVIRWSTGRVVYPDVFHGGCD